MHWHKVAIILAAVGLLPLQAGAQAPSPPPKGAVTAGEIEKLIRQLGSDSFPEREAASKKLEGIGASALDALRRAARRMDDLEARLRTARLVGRIENRLDGLLVDYRTHGLPLPPPQAKLVRNSKGKDGRTDDELGRLVYGLTFQNEPETKGGAEEGAPDSEAIKDVALDED